MSATEGRLRHRAYYFTRMQAGGNRQQVTWSVNNSMAKGKCGRSHRSPRHLKQGTLVLVHSNGRTCHAESSAQRVHETKGYSSVLSENQPMRDAHFDKRSMSRFVLYLRRINAIITFVKLSRPNVRSKRGAEAVRFSISGDIKRSTPTRYPISDATAHPLSCFSTKLNAGLARDVQHTVFA